MLSQAGGRKWSSRPLLGPAGSSDAQSKVTSPLRSHTGEPGTEIRAAAGRQLAFTASLQGAEQSKAAHSAEAELAAALAITHIWDE